MTRALDDLILDLRTNELELGTWVLRTEGDAGRVLAYDALVARAAADGDWLATEILLYLKRTLKRLDVTSRSLIALIEPGSCFAGSLLELALAADRSYMLDGTFEDDGDDRPAPEIVVGELNSGPLPMANGLTRLAVPVPRRPGRRWPRLSKQRGRAAGRGRGRGARPGHVRPGRHRLGRRGPHRDRGAGQLQPGRADRAGGELPVRRPGDHGDQDLRPPDRLAELDLQPARTRPARTAPCARSAPGSGPIRPEASLTDDHCR